jgi:hypothetical protein
MSAGISRLELTYSRPCSRQAAGFARRLCPHEQPQHQLRARGGGGWGGAHARFNALLAWAHRVQAFFAEPRQFYDTAVRLERPAWRVVQFPDGMAKLCSWGHAGCCFYAHVTWNYERVIEDVRALHKKGAGATEHVSVVWSHQLITKPG